MCDGDAVTQGEGMETKDSEGVRDRASSHAAGEVALRVRGTELVRANGRSVVLRGVGLGGWMNMENFITGYPATESQQRRALLRALGAEGYRRFFDRFLETFFSPRDAAFLSSLGMNSVRIPFNYRHFEDDDRPFELKPEGFDQLDRAVDACSARGIYTILDLHAVPGAQNQHWHSDNPTHWAQFWTHRHFQDRVVHLWEALADRYKGNPWVAGFNPVNEPADVSGEVIGPFYRRLEHAIRAVDPEHILFLDGNRYSTEFDVLGAPMPNTVYTAHDYALAGFADSGPYPGVSRGQHVDRTYLERTFRARTEYMRRTGTPIWIGEFGPVYTGDTSRDVQRYQLLRDQLEIYQEHGASWSLWTRRTWSGSAPWWRKRPGSGSTPGVPWTPESATSWSRSSGRSPRSSLTSSPIPGADSAGSNASCATSCWPNRSWTTSAGVSRDSPRGRPRRSRTPSRLSAARCANPSPRSWGR